MLLVLLLVGCAYAQAPGNSTVPPNITSNNFAYDFNVYSPVLLTSAYAHQGRVTPAYPTPDYNQSLISIIQQTTGTPTFLSLYRDGILECTVLGFHEFALASLRCMQGYDLATYTICGNGYCQNPNRFGFYSGSVVLTYQPFGLYGTLDSALDSSSSFVMQIDGQKQYSGTCDTYSLVNIIAGQIYLCAGPQEPTTQPPYFDTFATAPTIPPDLSFTPPTYSSVFQAQLTNGQPYTANTYVNTVCVTASLIVNPAAAIKYTFIPAELGNVISQLTYPMYGKVNGLIGILPAGDAGIWVETQNTTVPVYSTNFTHYQIVMSASTNNSVISSCTAGQYYSAGLILSTIPLGLSPTPTPSLINYLTTHNETNLYNPTYTMQWPGNFSHSAIDYTSTAVSNGFVFSTITPYSLSKDGLMTVNITSPPCLAAVAGRLSSITGAPFVVGNVLARCYSYDTSGLNVVRSSFTFDFVESSLTYAAAGAIAIPVNNQFDNVWQLSVNKAVCNVIFPHYIPIGKDVNGYVVISGISSTLDRQCFNGFVNFTYLLPVGYQQFFSEGLVTSDPLGLGLLVNPPTTPLYLTPGGYVVNQTALRGPCTITTNKGCYNTQTQYVDTVPGFNEAYIYSSAVIQPNISLILSDSPYSNYSGSSVTTTTSCLGSSNVLIYVFCVAPGPSAAITVVVSLMFLLMVGFFVLTCYTRRRRVCRAVGFYFSGFPKLAAAVYNGNKILADHLASKSQDDLKDIESRIPIDIFPPIPNDVLKKYEVCAKTALIQAKDKYWKVAASNKFKDTTPLLSSKSCSHVHVCLFVLLLSSSIQLSLSLSSFASQNFYSTPLKQSVYLAQTGLPLSSITTSFYLALTPQMFQEPPGVNPVPGTVGTASCAGFLCICSLTGTIPAMSTLDGSFAFVSASCSNQPTLLGVRISTVEYLYSYNYMYTTTDFTPATAVTYSCSGTLPTPPTTLTPSSMTSTLNIANGPAATCCSNVGGGWAQAVTTTALSYSTVVHVFQAVYTGYKITYCVETITDVYCYDSVTGNGPVVFTNTAVSPPTGYYVGVYLKSDVVLKVVSGYFSAPNFPSYGTPGDIQFSGYDSTGAVLLPGVYPTAQVANYGTWVGTGCVDPNVAPHNAWTLSFVTQNVGSAPLVSSDATYPAFQTNPFNLRVMNATLSYNQAVSTKVIPVLTMPVEFLGLSQTADLAITSPIPVYLYQQSTPAITSVTFSQCSFIIGDPLNSVCTMTIAWALSKYGYVITIVTDQMAVVRPTGDFIVNPRYSVYTVRMIVYSTPAAVKFTATVQGNVVGTSTVSNSITSNGGATATANSVIDPVFTFSSGNVIPTGVNTVVITIVSTIVGLVIILFSAATAGFAYARHLYNKFNVKNLQPKLSLSL